MLLASAPVTAPVQHNDRRAAAIALGVALVIAWIRGFRAPNLWSATLQSISLVDGFHRRFLVGTLLRPVVMIAGYRYAVFACFGYAVLVALLWIVIRAALRTPLWSRRAVVLAWLLLPSGGFVFDEVGYFDQVLYLILFAGVALLARGRLAWAAVVMALAPMVHEIAALTVLPVFGWLALRQLPVRKAVLVTAPAAVIAGVVLIVPPATAAAIPALEAALAHADFVYRIDALSLFERTQAASWKLYSIHAQWLAVQATTMIAVLGLVALWWADGAANARARVVACAAAAAPSLLIFGGWDDNRWIFLIVTNFLLVVWYSLADRRDELGARAASVLLIALLLFSQNPSYYFDGLKPRALSYRELRRLLV
ncbi:MAG TPA: hypothetical protein VGC42_15885, partial [Kofleriaceae bacterium]